MTGFIDDCDILARALATHVDMFFAVTGQPVTHLIDRVTAVGARIEISVNEKSAVEAAVGYAAVGGCSGVIVKQCGLAFALDSLANAAVHGIGGAMLVISGDDCDASHSTCIYDSRQLAEIAGLPVIDLALNGDTGELVGAAVRESEAARVPAVIRVTGLLHAMCQDRTTLDDPVTSPRAAPPKTRRTIDVAVAHELTKLGRHQRHRLVVLQQLQSMHAISPMLQQECADECDIGVVVSGAAIHRLPEGPHCRLIVRGTWPLSPNVFGFAQKHPRTLVIEEPRPYLERAIGAVSGVSVIGRLTGHLPPEGSLTAVDVSAALHDAPPQSWSTITRKSPPRRDQKHAYSGLFEAITRLKLDGAFVAADVGSSVHLCYPPYQAASVALSLGSAIGVAGGAARAGRRAIAVIGDYGLTHSGLEALMDCCRHQLPVVVVILDNRAQTQTGGQPIPHADREALARACGAEVVLDWQSSIEAELMYEQLAELVRGAQPSVVFVRAAGIL